MNEILASAKQSKESTPIETPQEKPNEKGDAQSGLRNSNQEQHFVSDSQEQQMMTEGEEFAPDTFDDIATEMECDDLNDVSSLYERDLFKPDKSNIAQTDTRSTSTTSSRQTAAKYLIQENDPASVLDGIYGAKKPFSKSFRKTGKSLTKDDVEFRSPLSYQENIQVSKSTASAPSTVSKPSYNARLE